MRSKPNSRTDSEAQDPLSMSEKDDNSAGCDLDDDRQARAAPGCAREDRAKHRCSKGRQKTLQISSSTSHSDISPGASEDGHDRLMQQTKEIRIASLRERRTVKKRGKYGWPAKRSSPAKALESPQSATRGCVRRVCFPRCGNTPQSPRTGLGNTLYDDPHRHSCILVSLPGRSRILSYPITGKLILP